MTAFWSSHAACQPKFYEAIKDAEPVSPIYAHRATANRLRHYEKVMLLGLCSFRRCPFAPCAVYGQRNGCALSAMVLRDWLSELHSWDGATLTLPKAWPKQFLALDFSNGTGLAFLQHLVEASPVSSVDCCTGILSGCNVVGSRHTLFIEVAHLLKSPLALYHP